MDSLRKSTPIPHNVQIRSGYFLKQGSVTAIPFRFQPVQRDEPQGCGIDAVPPARGGGTVVKHMP